jgi:hypothetical protein
LLEDSIHELMKVQKKADKKLVMFWDEVPYMINSIRKRDGEQAAVEVLDTLRSLRQENPDLRMVFTGSIGLHHVLQVIQNAQIPSAPLNDMHSIEVTPLEADDAVQLAEALLDGEGLTASDSHASAIVIASEADYFPFYIHHIVQRLRLDGIAPEPDDIRDLVKQLLVHPDDPWELGHFRNRISIYYAAEDRGVVSTVLDQLADVPQATVAELLNVVQLTSVDCTREKLIRVLRLMERDHYIHRNSDGVYQFRFDLVKRWWRLDRGI